MPHQPRYWILTTERGRVCTYPVGAGGGMRQRHVREVIALRPPFTIERQAVALRSETDISFRVTLPKTSPARAAELAAALAEGLPYRLAAPLYGYTVRGAQLLRKRFA